MSKNDGGSAFPVPGHSWEAENGRDWRDPVKGMSLRDYFAAAALQSILRGKDSNFLAVDDAEWAYTVADAMLAERTK